jgi:SAM-dependent methyltransferase
MVRKSVLEYFAEKADRYDDVDDQVYWRLSDELLWSTLTEDIIPCLETDEPTLLDAGGGTGRWSIRTLEAYSEMNGVLFDLSEKMLDEARTKLAGDPLERRLDIRQGDLLEIDNQVKESFDLVYCFHNVLGFVSDPEQVVDNLASCLVPSGLLVCFVPNKYHGVYFNIKTGRIDTADRIAEEEVGTFTDEMPDMYFFTPSGLEETVSASGLEPVMTRGLPVSVYPGYEETQISGNTETLRELLSTEFEKVFDIERRLSESPEAAARGNNVLLVARK